MTTQILGAEDAGREVEVLQTDHVDTSRLRGVLEGVARPLAALRALPHAAVYLGMLLILAGGILELIAWNETALLDNVGLQMPYVISAGCTGLALVAGGLTVINLAAKADDSKKQRAQMAELHDLLAEIRRAVEEDA